MKLYQGRRIIFYFLKELLPSFFIGVFGFVTLIVIFQSFRITDFILNRGGDFKAIAYSVIFMAISIIPLTLPISLLFSILTTYGRLNAQGEIGACRHLGFELKHIALPAVVLSLFVFLASLLFSFSLAPLGAKKVTSIADFVRDIKPSSIIKPGVFTKSFDNLIFYVKDIDKKSQQLKKLFIYDERRPSSPVTIIADHGKIIENTSQEGQHSILRLRDGKIHKLEDMTYTQVQFNSYDINIFYEFNSHLKDKPIVGLTSAEILEKMNSPLTSSTQKNQLKIEYNKRWSIAVASLIFGLLSVCLIVRRRNERSKSNSEILIGLMLTCIYWGLIVLAETLAMKVPLLTSPLIWTPNIIFLCFTIFQVKKSLDV